MPIMLHDFSVPGGVAQPGYAEAKALAKLCVRQYHYNILPGPGGGLAAGSCWAAVALQPNQGAGYPAELAFNNPPGAAGLIGAPALPFGATFGNSRMAAIAQHVPVPGMPPGGFAGHAERNALRNVPHAVQLYALPAPAAPVQVAGHQVFGNAAVAGARHAVLFVQLQPCPNCQTWLLGTGGAGGRVNPFAAAIDMGLLVLHVWYRWQYPAQVQAMVNWNGTQTLAAKLAQIAAW